MAERHTDWSRPSPDAVWQRLSRAADFCDDVMRLLTVATVDERCRPSARLMVLRGANPGMRRLWFYTAQDSIKAGHIRRRPDICAVGYDPAEMLQIVVRGRAEVRRDGEFTDGHWAQFQICAQNIVGRADEMHCSRPIGDPWMTAAVRSLAEGNQSALREKFALIDLHVDSIECVCINGPAINRSVFDLASSPSPTASARARHGP